MHRRITAAGVLAAFLAAAMAVPMTDPLTATAASACGTYRSETAPPPAIRVFRAATGAVETVDFRAYVKSVLSREWISSWTTESLRSGALAVKNYAWYQVIHWRGYTNAAGQCFDVFDSTRDQHYDPSRPTYAPMAAAVDATWSTLALKGGRIFVTYYNAGRVNEPCGAGANGWQMFQWGTQACGLAGKSAAQILAIYYSGVTVSAAPTPSTPAPTASPTPSPSPRPTATPAPAPTPAPKPGSSSTPVPTAAPTPTPLPTLAPTPTPALAPQQPGGGQVGLAAPPTPPPPDPEPIVVSVADVTTGQIEGTAASTPVASRASGPDLARLLAHEASADAWHAERARPLATRSWVAFRVVLEWLLSSLLERLGQPGPEQATDNELGRGHVLDREANRLEGGDGLGVAGRGPAGLDAPDLDEVPLSH
jgi:hypothetical protein